MPRVELAPLRRLHEGPGPYAALGVFRLVLFGLIGPRKAIGDRPALAHHPGIDVGAVGELTDRECAPILVERFFFAGELLAADIVAQLARGTGSASPRATPGIGAHLRAFGRVD